MDKAPDAFRTISEVADEIDIPQHVLRFWESRFAQIKPMKRGGGRRYYRPDDVDLLRGVRHLLYGEGYTIRGVQRILRDEGAAFVQNVWRAGATAPPPQSEDDRAEVDFAEAVAKRVMNPIFRCTAVGHHKAATPQNNRTRTSGVSRHFRSPLRPGLRAQPPRASFAQRSKSSSPAAA